jgi:hypothetical protein
VWGTETAGNCTKQNWAAKRQEINNENKKQKREIETNNRRRKDSEAERIVNLTSERTLRMRGSEREQKK